MSEQLGRAWMDFLAAETAVQPVLLVLEDLHWGDFGTVRFIDTALRERGKLPWMMLALARPEIYETFSRLWAERKHVQQIRLKELGKKAGERLVRQARRSISLPHARCTFASEVRSPVSSSVSSCASIGLAPNFTSTAFRLATVTIEGAVISTPTRFPAASKSAFNP